MSSLFSIEDFVDFGVVIDEISFFIENSKSFNEYPKEGILDSFLFSLEFFDYQKIAVSLISCYENNKEDFDWVLGFLKEMEKEIIPEVLTFAVYSKNKIELVEELIIKGYGKILDESSLEKYKKEFPEIFKAVVINNSYENLQEIEYSLKSKIMFKNDILSKNVNNDMKNNHFKVVKF